MNTNYKELLIRSGFKPCINNTDVIFSRELRKELSLLGYHFSESFISADIISKLKVSENETFKDEEDIKKEFTHMFGEKFAGMIITRVKENIKEKIGFNSTKQLQEILNEIRKSEILDFIYNLNKYDQVLVFWNGEEFRNRVFDMFFKNKNYKSIFFDEYHIPLRDIIRFSDEQILKDKSMAIKKEIEIINNVSKSNTHSSQIFVARSDMTKWFTAGLVDEFLEFRRSEKIHFGGIPICRLCGFDTNKNIDENITRQVLSLFQTVIIEDVNSIYTQR